MSISEAIRNFFLLKSIPNARTGLTWETVTWVDITYIIDYILSIALTVAGAVGVLFIIIGGYKYLLAFGNEDQAKNGRDTIMWAVIGVAVAIIARVVVNIVFQFLQTPYEPGSTPGL